MNAQNVTSLTKLTDTFTEYSLVLVICLKKTQKDLKVNMVEILFMKATHLTSIVIVVLMTGERMVMSVDFEMMN